MGCTNLCAMHCRVLPRWVVYAQVYGLSVVRSNLGSTMLWKSSQAAITSRPRSTDQSLCPSDELLFVVNGLVSHGGGRQQSSGLHGVRSGRAYVGSHASLGLDWAVGPGSRDQGWKFPLRFAGSVSKICGGMVGNRP